MLLRIGGDADIMDSNGNALQVVDEAVYLGGLVSCNGRPVCELTRRMGEAGRTFRTLQAVWKHANINRTRKIKIFEACVLSKLLYGLESAWLPRADRNKLDGFFARCLRKIYAIKPAFLSRVSNAEVLARASAKPLSTNLLARQLIYYGKIACRESSDLTRIIAFGPSGCKPRKWSMRKAGRPCLRWTSCVYAHALSVAGGKDEELERLLQAANQRAWRNAVNAYCFS